MDFKNTQEIIEKYQTGGQLLNSSKLKDNQYNSNLQEYNRLKKEYGEQLQAIGINDINQLNKMGITKNFNKNDLIANYNTLQSLRNKLKLGFVEDAKLSLPLVGQQVRGTFNQWLGTHFKKGGIITYSLKKKD